MKTKEEPSFLAALSALAEQVAQGKPAPETPLPYLTARDIRLCKPVFQHRQPLKHVSDAHIKELAKTPQHGKDLDPITVWWDGRGWVCIDGHHRIEAYGRAGKDNYAVPVEVFSGPLEAAVARAAEGNTRDKLTMSSREKTETAWRLTLADTSFSKAKVAELSGASARTVATMREAKAKLLQLQPECDLSELSWHRARMLARGQEVEEINWEERIEKEAQQFANILAKHLGKRGHQRREAFVRALEIYDAGLPEFLREEWKLDEEDDEIDIED